MTLQVGFRASRNLAEVFQRDECWDNLGIDRRDLALLVGTSAAGVTQDDYANCANLATFLEPQISGVSALASSGFTAMTGKIGKNGDSGIGTISGNVLNNDRAYTNAAFDIVSASTNSYFSPIASGGYEGGAQYLLGSVSIPSLTISGFNFRGPTLNWSNYFVKYQNYLQFIDSGSTVRYSPLYLAPPSALTSNVLWFDSEFSSFTLSGSGVVRWDDVLLRGYASQADALYRPVLIANDIANKNGVYFDGSNDFLNIGSIGGSIPTEATIIITVSLSNVSSGGDTVYSLLSSLANTSSAWRSGSGNGNWGLLTGSIISGFPTNMPVNGTLVMSVRASTAYGLEVRINGARRDFRTPGTYTYNSSGNYVLGVSDSTSRSNALRGSIHSVAFFNKVLTDAELNSQELYMSWRHGFIYELDAAAFSFTKVIHDERTAEFRLEDDSIVEAD